MEEQWKPIVGYEGMYEVSNLGRVRSFRRGWNGRLIKPKTTKKGYKQVCISVDGIQKHYLVHRLVLTAFEGLPPSPEHESNHTEGERSDNRIDKLEWVTPSENVIHAYEELDREPPCGRGEDNRFSKLTNDHIPGIFLDVANGKSPTDIALELGMHYSAIVRIIRRKNWSRTEVDPVIEGAAREKLEAWTMLTRKGKANGKHRE